MKKIHYNDIVDKIKNACIDINYNASKELLEAYDKSIQNESDVGKTVLSILKDNVLLAHIEQVPICQDTGTAVIFVTLGANVIIENGFLNDAIFEGVEKGYREGYLRKSIVDNPLTRHNSGNNLPPVIHIELVKGDTFMIDVAAKGGGSENMSALKMLTPADGMDGIKSFVVETVKKAGPNPCPPIIVGIGIGSNFEGVALLAKKALLEPFNSCNLSKELADMEKELEEKLNNLSIGPQGLGGKTTVFKVHSLMAPCHIASLPVAVNINCHVSRHTRIIF
ncbi:fumarate hydratase [endosymbiont 'TC1' of Trimyema compressum]|uniref:fumarate hydratase n=1 Tax=endosymbiont 'TC1' of Trimyema compressum TaxID=243899 RepID=UPI0007F09805|nr:fumarate hydratase [endosymbiont 'TC1' of Trimyema compressum]AMP20591.1 fumarate hydratase [endosymbiont 'TC1' of Trimyema compressum]